MKWRTLALAFFMMASSVCPLPAAARIVAAQPRARHSCTSVTHPHGAKPVVVRVCTGTISAASYLIEVPVPWNRTLFLFSHGTTAPGDTNPASDSPDRATASWLLANGFALAGSAFSSTGWAVQAALRDQRALLDYFAVTIGNPARTIAWGESQGGLVAAGLVERYPRRFSAAPPLCGALAGSIGSFNAGLDAAFVFNTLVVPGSRLQLAHISNPIANDLAAQGLLYAAQQTARSRARIALAAALYDIPGWYTTGSPEPTQTNVAAREQAQFRWEQEDWGLAFIIRADMEAKAGGNPSWNTGVDYRRLLAASVDRAEVQTLYRQAGLNLNADLAALARARRISADPKAVAYLRRNILLSGNIQMPVLSLHTTGDGEVPVEQEQAYAAEAADRGRSALLRQLFVHRAGHCAFTPAEKITAIRSLTARLDTGAWPAVGDVAGLNREAAALGKSLNTSPASFVAFRPAVFLRPYSGGSVG
jgi:pimeloyl-ACP methyl ester carboxylesterase